MEAMTDVWSFVENAPDYVSDVADLWHWSTNYGAGEGPITLFLDLIGYSDEEFGQPVYAPTVRLMSNAATGPLARDMSSWDASLGYLELDKLADALKQYTATSHRCSHMG